ncbi:MAG: M48 family metallopeptidase [Candidatus Pacebacteria bacterium]|nr:M48 family metallopeptidase [Candidatus Paceibacterota bacterium]
MANLYSQAESNVRRTWFLISAFLVLVILLGWIFSQAFNNSAILYIAVIFSFFTSISSYWFSDKIVLAMANAYPLRKEDNPEIYRLVENLCITAGLPLPKIYVLMEEQPNAFAAGRDENHAVIAITKGLVEKLEKVELEGVIAHELAHVKNRDTLLQTAIVVLVGIVAVLSNMFLRTGFRKRDDGNSPLFAVLGIVAAIFAPLAANLIKLALSRQREFLADASGALLTRYPEGLASALEKIAFDENELSKASPATAHLFIASPFREGEKGYSWLAKLFMTHPPVEERIRALADMRVE